MTDRYTLFKINNLQERFHLKTPSEALKRSYNINPTQSASVVVERGGMPVLEQMKWGFIPTGAKDTNSVFRYKTFNARSEGIFTKSQWGEAIRSRRCLVLANGFYVLRKTADGKEAYYVRPRDQELFAFAGVYSAWTDPEGKEWGTYSLVTVEANDDLQSITDRMPIILQPDTEARWLDPAASDVNTIYDLMRPYADGMLIVEHVGLDISGTKVDNPRLVTPIRTQ